MVCCEGGKKGDYRKRKSESGEEDHGGVVDFCQDGRGGFSQDCLGEFLYPSCFDPFISTLGMTKKTTPGHDFQPTEYWFGEAEIPHTAMQ